MVQAQQAARSAAGLAVAAFPAENRHGQTLAVPVRIFVPPSPPGAGVVVAKEQPWMI